MVRIVFAGGFAQRFGAKIDLTCRKINGIDFFFLLKMITISNTRETSKDRSPFYLRFQLFSPCFSNSTILLSVPGKNALPSYPTELVSSFNILHRYYTFTFQSN